MKGPCMQFNHCSNNKKSYGSHMNVNVGENAIQMCSKIRTQSHYGKNTILFITISNIFVLDLGLKLKSIHSKNTAKYEGSQYAI